MRMKKLLSFIILVIVFGTYECIAQSSNSSAIQKIEYIGNMQYGDQYETLSKNGKKFTGRFSFELNKEKSSFFITVYDTKDKKTLLSVHTKLSDISPIIRNNKFTGIEMLIDRVKYRLFKANDVYGIELRIGEHGEKSYLCEPEDAIIECYSKKEKISSYGNYIIGDEYDDYEEKIFNANYKFNDWMDFLKSLIGGK